MSGPIGIILYQTLTDVCTRDEPFYDLEFFLGSLKLIIRYIF